MSNERPEQDPESTEALSVEFETRVEAEGDKKRITIRIADAPVEDEGDIIRNGIDGMVERREDGTVQAWIEYVHLDEGKYRGEGVGSALFLEFMRYAKESGATELACGPVSREALKVLSRLFGREDMRLYEYDDRKGHEGMDFEQEIPFEEAERRAAQVDHWNKTAEALLERYGVMSPVDLPDDAYERYESYQKRQRDQRKEFCVVQSI